MGIGRIGRGVTCVKIPPILQRQAFAPLVSPREAFAPPSAPPEAPALPSAPCPPCRRPLHALPCPAGGPCAPLRALPCSAVGHARGPSVPRQASPSAPPTLPEAPPRP